MFLGERFGVISPRASYIRSVCGCISASSAATEIMKTPRSSSIRSRSVLPSPVRRQPSVLNSPPCAGPSGTPKSEARGLLPLSDSASFSTASRCSSVSSFGTSTRIR